MLQNTQAIITKFETYTGDTTELSSQNELDLAEKIYRKILNDRPWEFLKKAATGTITITNGVATITPPTDFSYFTENRQATDISREPRGDESPKVIFVATATGVYAPYKIVNFSDRRQYINNCVAYYDAVNNLITFTQPPIQTDLSYEFDYAYVPPQLTVAAPLVNPVFPQQFWDIIFHGMTLDDLMIQLFDRSHAYQAENQAAYDNYLNQLQYWNSQLINY